MGSLQIEKSSSNVKDASSESSLREEFESSESIEQISSDLSVCQYSLSKWDGKTGTELILLGITKLFNKEKK
jgi:hypothetical protein